ncbi:MAG: ferrous iron transport protein A [Spirochaetes bacterium]|uniref:Ferrous iron transport protein A n=1 Tax=Candidatus Ornithospirochaeta stercoravium TaxID=2840897 RepID=A0A9D9IBJ0_9SPIO|nr:ferrous iron transport protein A [Candidatus Ornithospirochaeta stercoravium]
MPLSLLSSGNSGKIARISGSGDIRRYLQNLGFIEGREVKVLSDIGGDVIVGVLDSRIALNKEMASHIYV